MKFPQVERRSRRYAARQFVSDFETGPKGVAFMSEKELGAVERSEGVVKFFNADKGFGFCRRDHGVDVFIHANALKRSGIEGGVQTGDRLEFDVIPVDGKGPKAANIKRLSAAD